MDIKSLKFNTIFDVADCFIDDKNITSFLMKFFELAYNVSKKSDGKFSAIIKTKKYYNVDYELLVVAFFEFLKEQGVGELELAKVKVMFAKDCDDNLKNNLFFVNVLAYFDLVVPPKGSYFYLRILNYNSEKKSYFSYNSIGLSESSLAYYIGKDVINDHIEFLATNQFVTSISMGQKNVHIFMKERRIGEREVLKSQEFLEIWVIFYVF